MKEEILEFLKTQEVGVLAVEMLDGSPHGATVHFAFGTEPLAFYFETNREYRKAEALLGRAASRATFVVTDEASMKSMQLDGEVSLVKDRASFDAVYFEKFPKKLAKAGNPNTLYFTFVPKWWRYTDFKHPDGKRIIASKD